MVWFVAHVVRAGDSVRDGYRPCHLSSFHLTCVDCLLQLIRSFAANCFSHSVAGVYPQSAPIPSFAMPRTTAGLVPLSFASNEVNVKICGGYWGGDGQEETSPGAASAVSRRTNYTPKEHQLGRYSRS